jgi:hypothetical protein
MKLQFLTDQHQAEGGVSCMLFAIVEVGGGVSTLTEEGNPCSAGHLNLVGPD